MRREGMREIQEEEFKREKKELVRGLIAGTENKGNGKGKRQRIK